MATLKSKLAEAKARLKDITDTQSSGRERSEPG